MNNSDWEHFKKTVNPLKDQKKMTNSASPTPPSKPRSALSALLRFFRLRSHSASFFNSTGLARSFRENRPVNKDGEPLPWLNYSLIRLLDERLRQTLRVFEYTVGMPGRGSLAKC